MIPADPTTAQMYEQHLHERAEEAREQAIRDQEVKEHFLDGMMAIRDYFAPLPDDGPDCDGCGDPAGEGYRTNGHILLCESCSSDHGRRL